VKVVIAFLLALVCCLGACAPIKPVAPEGPVSEAGPVPEIEFGQPCTSAEGEHWLAEAPGDPRAAFRGAACWAYLAEQKQKGAPSRLTAASNGRQLAKSAVAAWPDSGMAHYLLAYLTGLVAEETPLQGLKLVPVIEREAQQAARLQPDIDHAGPDRMLGELYLRAPEFPVSIGDPAQAVDYYRKAVDLAPGFNANRLGLVEALLADEQTAAACKELNHLFRSGFPNLKKDADWQKTLELQERLCGQIGAQ
jgi:tetratricopeptide (TPR) repeat protein